MTHSYLGSAPKKQNHNSLVESKQGKFPVVGLDLHRCLELTQRRWEEARRQRVK